MCIRDRFTGFANSEGAIENFDSGEEGTKETAPTSAVAAESAKVEDASAAFDELFNK